MSLALAQQTFSVKDQKKVFQAFESMWHLVKTTQLCHSSTKAAFNNMQMKQRGRVSIKLYIQKQAAAGFVQTAVVCQILMQSNSFLFSFPFKMMTLRSRDATDLDLPQHSWQGNLGLLTLRSKLLGLDQAALPRCSCSYSGPHSPSSSAEIGMCTAQAG